LGHNNQIESVTAEEEMEAFVRLKDGAYLKIFHSYVKVMLNLCVILAGGYILYKIFPFFSSIYAFFEKCYDFVKDAIV
jgi:hypothetical protein